jgi:DNA repair photolyase
VFKDFDKVVEKQLDTLLCASCGYISPTTDPFQPVNNRYQLTEKIIEVFLNLDLPVEIITKGVISDKALKLMARHPYNHSFGQVSILTLNDDKRKQLVLGKGATSQQLLKNIKKLSDFNIHSVCRIDPIIPYINDNINDIKEIIDAAVEAGVKHIGISILDIPIFLKKEIINHLSLIGGQDIVEKYEKLYTEKITSDLHSNISYRKTLLKKIKEYCQEIRVTMSTCMEFEIIKKNGKKIFESLNNNNQFMTSDNCEGINIPLYKRKKITDRFKPVKCKGNCLYCVLDPVPCRILELKEAKNWKLKDYRRWSQTVKSNEFKEISSFL